MERKYWAHEIRAFTRYRSADGTQGVTNSTAGITFKNGLYVGGSLNTAGLPLSTDNITILGEAGNGYLAFSAQSAAPVQALSHIYVDAAGLVTLGRSGSSSRGIKFDNQILTADRTYLAPNKSGTFAMTDDNVSQFTNDAGYLQIASLANYVQGPASSLAGSLPSFSSTAGKFLQDSGIAASSVIVGPASAVSANLPTFSGTTGKLIQDSGVAISAVVLNARTITEGAGLAGNTYDLSANRTLAMGMPSGLSLASVSGASGTTHSHAITASSNPGAAASLLATNASGDLTIQNLSVGGTVFLPVTSYHTDIGQLSKKFRGIHGAELFVETLVAQDTQATVGGRILVGRTTSLIADALAAATTIDVKHNNLANGHRIYFEADGKVEFMAVTSGATVITGGYRYSVTRNLDGTGANDWFAGDAVFNTGTTGDGFIDLYSQHGVKSTSEVGPTIVGNIRQSATYNDWKAAWAIGNLQGLYGYGAATFGVGLGLDGSTDFITVDPTNGLRITSGNGGVTLDGSGMTLAADIDTTGTTASAVKWQHSGTQVGHITSMYDSGLVWTAVQAKLKSADATSQSNCSLFADNNNSSAGVLFLLTAKGSSAAANPAKTYANLAGNGSVNFLGLVVGSISAVAAYMLDIRGTGRFTGAVTFDAGVSGKLSGSTTIGARVYNSANIAVAHATIAFLTFDSERWDTDTIHSTASNTGRLTATTAGKYEVKGHIRWQSNATGYRQTRITKNAGRTIIALLSQAAVNGDSTDIMISAHVDLAAGDYVELGAYQNSGISLNVESGAEFSPEFSMARCA